MPVIELYNLCDKYLGEKGHYTDKCNPASYSLEFNVFSDSSDTSHSIYLRAVFMTVFTQHPEAIIRGLLI